MGAKESRGEENTVKKKVFDGMCYNFALVLVNDRLLNQGHWIPEEAIEKSSMLSKKIQKTVNDFFERQPKMAAHLGGKR